MSEEGKGEEPCPAPDASGAEKQPLASSISPSSAPSPSSAEPRLIEAILLLIEELKIQNQYLAQIVQHNADLLALVVDEAEQAEEQYDLAGKRIRSS